MWGHGTFTCICAHTSCYVEDVVRHAWGGVGWGNNVHVLAHFYDVRPRHVHLHLRTYVMLRWRCRTSRMGWGGAITFTYLRTSMMWGHGTFTCICAHTSCYVEDVVRHAWGGVGWGNNVHVLAHFYHVRPRHVHLHLRTYVMLYVEDVVRHAWGGVGWGNNVHVLAHFYDVRPRHVHSHLRTYIMLRWRCRTSRMGWGGAITFTYLRTSMMWGHGTFTCICVHTSQQSLVEVHEKSAVALGMSWQRHPGRNWTNPGDVLKNEKGVSVSDSF